MKGVNTEWALLELNGFIQITQMKNTPDEYGVLIGVPVGSQEELIKKWEIIEELFDRLKPGWRSEMGSPSAYESEWLPYRNMAIRVRERLERQEELRNSLGENAPELSAANLHPWVWDGARSLWQSCHYREAVEGAIRKVNAETQNKLDRRDVSETDLFNQAFSDSIPSKGNPRLHRMPNDGGKTFKSVQRGARTYAEGVFAGIRNPLAHEADQDMGEQQALEYLAALSVLARWVDDATLEVTP